MSLTARVDRLEDAIGRRDCPESHVWVHVARVDLDATETADPEPGPCPTCGGMLNMTRVVITTVPDRGG